LFSCSFTCGILIRRLLYKTGMLKTVKFQAKIIAVGNITMGGTGKTPFVEELARRITKTDKKLLIVAKGYKRKKLRDIDIVSDGNELLLSAKNAGDEAFLVARNVKKAAVIVSSDKIKGIEFGAEKMKPDIILLDDGFQKRHVLSDAVNIVMLDAINPLGFRRLFPSGMLREPVSSLRDAPVVVITNTNLVEQSKVEAIKEVILKYNRNAKIFESEHQPRFFYNVFTGEKEGLGFVKGRKAIIFSSLGNPIGFERTMKNLGVQIVAGIRFRDHHRLKKREIEAMNKLVARTQANIVLTTEKDEVKLARKYFDDENIYALKIGMLIKNVKDLDKKLRI